MKKQTAITLLAITSALLLGGCGLSGKPSSSPDKPIEQSQNISEGAMTRDSSVQKNGLILNGLFMNGLNMNGLFLKDLAARPLEKQK